MDMGHDILSSFVLEQYVIKGNALHIMKTCSFIPKISAYSVLLSLSRTKEKKKRKKRKSFIL